MKKTIEFVLLICLLSTGLKGICQARPYPAQTKKDSCFITSGTQHGTAIHWATMNTVAKDLADKGETVYLNKWINTALGKEINAIGNWKPDVLSIAKNGRITITEVISPSQTEQEIINKVTYMAKELVKQGYKVTTRVVTESGKVVK